MFRPSVEFTADTHHVNLIDVNGSRVIFGDPPNGHVGIQFDLGFGVDENGFQRPPPETGDFKMTQLVETTMIRKRSGVDYLEQLLAAGVDGDFSYEFGDPGRWVDSPGSGLSTSWEFYSRIDSFMSYLMFNPARGKNPIYVPLQVIGWGWSASLANDSGWQLLSHGGNEDEHLEGVDTIEFPEFYQWIQNEVYTGEWVPIVPP